MRKMYSFRLPIDMVERLRKLAESDKSSLSSYIIKIIDKHLRGK